EDESSNDLVFIERSYLSEILPGFKIGAGYNGTVGLLGFSGNVYNLREASDGEARPTNSGAGAVARAFVAPLNERTLALHIGGSYAYESTDIDGERVRVEPIGRAQEYRSGEDFRFDIFDQRDARAQINRGLFESAFIDGPLTLQGEYLVGK